MIRNDIHQSPRKRYVPVQVGIRLHVISREPKSRFRPGSFLLDKQTQTRNQFLCSRLQSAIVTACGPGRPSGPLVGHCSRLQRISIPNKRGSPQDAKPRVTSFGALPSLPPSRRYPRASQSLASQGKQPNGDRNEQTRRARLPACLSVLYQEAVHHSELGEVGWCYGGGDEG